MGYGHLYPGSNGSGFLSSVEALVHDIIPNSPLYELQAENYARLGIEIIVQLKGYDDTFAQDVHARNSYTHDEIEWHRRFIRAYEVGDDGIAVVNLDQVHDTEALR